jgi:flagellar FliJ protein
MSQKTYKLLINIIQNQRDEAANILKTSQKKLKEAEDKAQQLEEFRREYQESFKNALQNGLDIASMNNYQKFIERLGETIRIQNDYIKLYHAQCEKDKKSWEAIQIKLRTYEKLVDREKQREALIMMRKERKAEDEFQAARQAQQKAEDEHEWD